MGDTWSYFGFQFQTDWEPLLPTESGLGNACPGKFKQIAITARLQTIWQKDQKEQAKNGSCITYYHQTLQLGPGYQRNNLGDWKHLKDIFNDHLIAWDFDSSKLKKDWKGMTLNYLCRVGVDTTNINYFNKVFPF